MNLKTKFNVGDSVWFIYNNKVENKEIYSIDINVNSKNTVINYDISLFPEKPHATTKKPENTVYKTKQELLDSL